MAAAAFCMPLKMAFVTTSFSLVVLFAMLFHAVRGPLRGAINMGNPAWWALGLFLWAAIRMLNGEASSNDAIIALFGLHELLALPLLVTIPITVEQRNRAFHAFIAGNLAAAGVSYGRYFGWLPIVSLPPQMYDPPQGSIAGSWMMAMAVFLCITFARQSTTRGAVAFLLAAGLMLVVLLVFTAGRTAYLVLFVLTVLAITSMSRRHASVTVLVLIMGFAVGWQVSPVMRGRVFETFESSQDVVPVTSTAIRKEIYRVSIAVGLDRPLFGHGLGSFSSVYLAKSKVVDIKGAPVSNPHSEYLYLWIELGVIGALMFIAMLMAAWTRSREMEEIPRLLTRALVLTMAVSCLFNSFLHDASPGRTFVLILAIALASRRSDDLNNAPTKLSVR